MKKLFLVLICSFLFSCGRNVCENSDFDLEQGICVYLNGHDFSKEKLEHVIDVTEREVNNKFGYEIDQMRKYYYNTSINISTGEEVKEKSKGYTSAGVTLYKLRDVGREYFQIFISDYGCISYSIFSHELLHVINISTEGKPSQDGASTEAHPKEWFSYDDYSILENLNSVEKIACDIIYEELCLR